MTVLSTLTDTELNEKIAKECGLWCESCAAPRLPQGANTLTWKFPPAYTDSIDALKSGPEKILSEAGWRWERIYQSDWSGKWYAELSHDKDVRLVAGIALTEERARAEAVCQGLEVGK